MKGDGRGEDILSVVRWGSRQAKLQRKEKYESDSRGGETGTFALTHTKSKLFISNVVPPGGEEEKKDSVNNPDRWGDEGRVIEDWQRETEITRLDWWLMKINAFLLEDMLSFSSLLWFSFFLCSDGSVRYTRCTSLCMHADCSVSKATHTLPFWSVLMSHLFSHLNLCCCKINYFSGTRWDSFQVNYNSILERNPYGMTYTDICDVTPCSFAL